MTTIIMLVIMAERDGRYFDNTGNSVAEID